MARWPQSIRVSLTASQARALVAVASEGIEDIKARQGDQEIISAATEALVAEEAEGAIAKIQNMLEELP